MIDVQTNTLELDGVFVFEKNAPFTVSIAEPWHFYK